MTEMAVRDKHVELVQRVNGEAFKQEITVALPAGVPADRFVRCVVTAVNQTPELIVADRRSFFNAVLRCAQAGLLPDGREAALVVVKDKKVGQAVAFWPMIFGYRKIAADHGIVLNAFVVCENDEFDYQLGGSPKIHHKPAKLGVDRGAVIGAYAVATWSVDGRMVCPPEVMDRSEIEKVRAVSRAATSEYGPWVKWWDQQARKTVARRLFKQLPLGDLSDREAAVVTAADDETDFGTSSGMTVDEANVAAALGPMVPPVQEPPEDHVPDEADWSEVDPSLNAEVEGDAFPIPESARQS